MCNTGTKGRGDMQHPQIVSKINTDFTIRACCVPAAGLRAIRHPQAVEAQPRPQPGSPCKVLVLLDLDPGWLRPRVLCPCDMEG